jgi:hypothetical protein
MHCFDNTYTYQQEESEVWRRGIILEKRLRAAERYETPAPSGRRQLIIDEASTTYLGISWPFETSRIDEVSWTHQNEVEHWLNVQGSHRRQSMRQELKLQVLRPYK